MRILKVLLVGSAFLLALLMPGVARAQLAGTYQPLTGTGKMGGGYGAGGGIIRVLANSTNVIGLGLAITNTMSQPGGTSFGIMGVSTNLVQDVSQFDYIGFTWSYAAGSNATVQVFVSDDGGTTYGALPAFTFSGPAAAATAFATNALLDVHGATHVAFVLKNASTIDETNVLLELHLKASKVRIVPNGSD